MTPIFFIALILGLCVGSFLNVLIYRLPKGMSVIGGRSFCPRCKKKISWFDNIPLLSFLLLKGRCRYCKKPISWRYPLVELVTGVLTVLAVSYQLSVISYQLSVICHLFTVLYFLSLVYSLILIFFIDLEHQIIPDEIILPMVLVSFFYSLITNYYLPASPAGGQGGLITNLLPTAIISSLFFLILHILTKGKGMGFGDVKFAFLIGLVLGSPKTIVCFYLSFLTGAIVGVILIVIRKAKFGKPIAFGPFLSLAFLITLWAGDKILWLVKQIFF